MRANNEEATYIIGAFIEFRINKICDINQGSGCTACRSETELAQHPILNPSMRLPKILNASGQPSSFFSTRLLPENNYHPPYHNHSALSFSCCTLPSCSKSSTERGWWHTRTLMIRRCISVHQPLNHRSLGSSRSASRRSTVGCGQTDSK